MLSSRAQDLSLMKKQNEAATKHSEITLQRQKKNEAFDVIKDVLFNNGNDIKNIEDEIRSSEERFLQNLNVHLSNVSSNLAEESPSLISVESDDKDKWKLTLSSSATR